MASRAVAALSRLTDEAVRSRLEREGFTYRVKGVLTTDIECGDVVGWLGTSNSSDAGRTEVDAYVGVHDPEVEETVARLQGRQYRAFVERTFGVPLHQLVPGTGYRPYTIGRDGGINEPAVERLARDVTQHGVPAMSSYCDRQALARAIEAEGQQNDLLYRLPVVYLRLGERERAAKLVKRLTREYADITEAARAYGRPEFDYSAFAERFLAEAEG